MTLDTTLRNAAAEVVALVGVDGTFTKQSTAYNPSTGTSSGGGTVWSATVSPPVDYAYHLAAGGRTADTVAAGEAVIYLAAQGLPSGLEAALVPGLLVVVNSEAFTVVAVERLISGALAAAFALVVNRRGTP